jgi:hypothetical protein
MSLFRREIPRETLAAEDFSATVEARQFFLDHAGQKHPAVSLEESFLRCG